MASLAATFALKRMLVVMPTQRARFFDVPGNAAQARVEVYYDDPSQKQAHREAAEDLQDALNDDPKEAIKILVESVYEPTD